MLGDFLAIILLSFPIAAYAMMASAPHASRRKPARCWIMAAHRSRYGDRYAMLLLAMQSRAD